jgi:hypothetical protein
MNASIREFNQQEIAAKTQPRAAAVQICLVFNYGNYGDYGNLSLGGHAHGGVNADGLAVQHVVFNDVLHQESIFFRLAQP